VGRTEREGKRKNRSFLCRGKAHAFGLISLLLSSLVLSEVEASRTKEEKKIVEEACLVFRRLRRAKAPVQTYWNIP
jgi:hypothetical protein